MMMRTAGGPGPISPIDFGERRKPLPRWIWGAIGVSALIHVGIGVALYNQRFEIDAPPTTPTPPTTTVTLDLPRPKLPPKVETPTPPAPQTPVHKPETLFPAETLSPFVAPDTPVTGDVGPTIVVSTATNGVEGGTGVVETETPRAASVINNPSWASRPSAAQMARAYPSRAATDGLSGAASLSCVVRVDGGLTACRVSNETPAGRGFGRAAMGLTRDFRMNPRTVDGRAVDGAPVIFTVGYAMEG